MIKARVNLLRRPSSRFRWTRPAATTSSALSQDASDDALRMVTISAVAVAVAVAVARAASATKSGEKTTSNGTQSRSHSIGNDSDKSIRINVIKATRKRT